MSLIPGGVGQVIAGKVDDVIATVVGKQLRWKLSQLGVNVAFMSFGAFGTVGNIINR
jgi:hypothetical protein